MIRWIKSSKKKPYGVLLSKQRTALRGTNNLAELEADRAEDVLTLLVRSEMLERLTERQEALVLGHYNPPAWLRRVMLRRIRVRLSGPPIKARRPGGLATWQKNAAKTECKRGHPLSGDNLKIGSDGNRRCRACDSARRGNVGRPNGWQKNATKAECKRGHPFSGENLHNYNGRRVCRACCMERCRRQRERKRQCEPQQ